MVRNIPAGDGENDNLFLQCTRLNETKARNPSLKMTLNPSSDKATRKTTFLHSLLVFLRLCGRSRLCTVKKVSHFPAPAAMSLTKLSLAGNYSIIPGQGEFCK